MAQSMTSGRAGEKAGSRNCNSQQRQEWGRGGRAGQARRDLKSHSSPNPSFTETKTYVLTCRGLTGPELSTTRRVAGAKFPGLEEGSPRVRDASGEGLCHASGERGCT